MPLFCICAVLLVLPIVYINRRYYKNGFKTLLRSAPNMDTLIAIGSGAARLWYFAIFRIGHGLGHDQFDIVDEYRMNLYFESATNVRRLTLSKCWRQNQGQDIRGYQAVGFDDIWR